MTGTTCYLITGAGKGLGLGFVCHLLKRDESNKVIACVRDKSECDQSFHECCDKYKDRCQCIQMDVAVPDSVKQALQEIEKGPCGSHGVDVLICNAGVSTELEASPLNTTGDHLKSTLLTNFYGVVNTTTILMPLLRKGHKKLIIHISSAYGSIGGHHGKEHHCAAYSVSKVAANMWCRKLAAEIGSEGFTVISLHPGDKIKTSMTDGQGIKEVDESVKQCIENVICKGSSSTLNGRFVSETGQELPW